MPETHSIELFEKVGEFLEQRAMEFDQIPDSRKEQLSKLSDYVRDRLEKGVAQLTFVCTHNSRRSHLSQLWAKVAADANGLTNVLTFSGGTEATAMNPRVVESLRRTGFEIAPDDPAAANPVYRVRYSDNGEPLVCFSKVYNKAPNPSSDFCAIMTCSSADKACPIVPGCDLRLPIRYEDPKVADGTSEEAAVYDERSRQIAREMLYMVKQV